MRYAVLNRRALAVCFVLFLSAVLVGSGIYNRAVLLTSAKAQKSKIPVYCVQTAAPKIAITLDAAWGAEDTDRLLEIFSKYNAKVTIFAVGDWVRQNPEAVLKFDKAGHEIANHSDQHIAYSKLSFEAIQKDIERCNAEIEKLTQKKPRYLRAPYGDYTPQAMECAEALSMQMVQWSVDSLDWQGLSVEEMVKRVTAATENGSILLFHCDVQNTPEALEKILETLSGRGFSFVTVGELLYDPPFEIDFSGRQRPKHEKRT